MTDLQKLQKKFNSASGKTQDLIQLLGGNSSPLTIALEGLSGSAPSFIISAVKDSLNVPQIILANNKETAAYLYNNLQGLVDDKNVLFFPDSFKRPTNFTQLDQNSVQMRTEVITQLSTAENNEECVVTYPEALFEKIVNPGNLKHTKIEIIKGEIVDVSTMIDILVEYDFSREDFVYEPGQFSIRGGIIDIFSFGNEWPYRIELFDEEVESIRTFDPISQLSKKNIAKVNIVPNVNTHFKSGDKIAILDILPENTLMWIQSPQYFIERLEKSEEAFTKRAKEAVQEDDEQLRSILKEKAIVNAESIMASFQGHHIITLKDAYRLEKVDHTISYDTKPQPSFNKNFSLLIDDIEANTKDRIETYIFSSNKKQIERLYAIFEDKEVNVEFTPIYSSLHEGFVDRESRIAAYTDHQIFQRFHRYRIKRGFSKDRALSLRMLKELKPGDFITHIDHGIGKFSGLEKIDINGHIQESVRIIYKNNDILYVAISSLHKISKYVGKDGTKPKLSKLGSDTWNKLKARTKKKVKDIAGELIKLYAKRRASDGHAFQKDGYLQNELEASFIYEDTPDQLKATIETKKDMEKPYPMDRLICGDAGFGKTEVAIRAAFKAVVGGKQVAILVPTTILALQHFRTFNERLSEFGVSIDYLNRFKSTSEKKEVYQGIKDGSIDIVVGTHALLNKRVNFKDLGLLVIDEEQKFGVKAKEKLRKMKVNVDTLIMTATPIPRTLQFALMSARDLSIMRTPPPNRRPIHTEIRIFNSELIQDSIYYETQRGGQVFFVHNRVKSLPEITEMVKRLCPDIDIRMAHGQMESKKLEKQLTDFIDGKFEVLLCTNIIETGLDIPNANTIIIHNAHQFGLSDLHQLRGRVGRSNRKAFCYLFCPPLSTLTVDARKRLKTLEEFSELGDGFNIALRDLDIRGAGNLLGAEQSGFIADIGYDAYHKILEEAIQELKETSFKDVFKEELAKKIQYVRDVTVETDMEMHIPDAYVTSIQERLNLYSELDDCETEDDIQEFEAKLRDMFGPVPKQVNILFEGLRLRWSGEKLGFERISLKKQKLRLYFIRDAQSSYFETDIFKNIVKFVNTNKIKGMRMKQTSRNLLLVKDNVRSIQSARKILKRIEAAVLDEAEFESV